MSVHALIHATLCRLLKFSLLLCVLILVKGKKEGVQRWKQLLAVFILSQTVRKRPFDTKPSVSFHQQQSLTGNVTQLHSHQLVTTGVFFSAHTMIKMKLIEFIEL